MDSSIRKALVIHPKNVPHNHPMPPMTKASYELRATYRDCVEAAGCVGSTVSKVDNGRTTLCGNFVNILILLSNLAPSTKLLLKGHTLSEYAPPLHVKRLKRDMVREVKAKTYPAGLDVPGTIFYFRDIIWDIHLPPAYCRCFPVILRRS